MAGRAVGVVGTFTHGDTAVILDLGPAPDSIPFYRRLGFELRPALKDRCYYLPARTGGR